MGLPRQALDALAVYGLESDSAWPMTFFVAIPNFACSQRVSFKEACNCFASPSTCASLIPTCSMPIDV
jgi:hypothetical protein